MTEELLKFTNNIIFGDLIFADIVSWPIKNKWLFDMIAHLYLSYIMPNMKFEDLYPTGKKQEEITGKHEKYLAWADVIVGDWHMIRRNLPRANHDLLKEKIIITNTKTDEDIKLLKARNVGMLITYTPKIDNRSFGTNVLEGILVAILKKIIFKFAKKSIMICLKR
jgi:hypothetical protein